MSGISSDKEFPSCHEGIEILKMDMDSEQPMAKGKRDPSARRKQKEAQALRDNLLRRKAQTRARAAADPTAKEPEKEE